MYAYIDETGNTGKNIFDKNQPIFVTAGLLTQSNFDLVYGPAINSIAKSIGLQTLHANEIGFKGIELIADKLLRVLKSAGARFFFSRVEKTYLVTTKIVDHIFDSGENPSVPFHIYNFRPLRLMLVFRLGMILDESLASEFWNCLMERNDKKSQAHLVSFCEAVLPRTPDLPDKRTQDLVREALEWTVENPGALRIQSNTKHALQWHMPNLVAFANLIDGLNLISTRSGSPIRSITYDRQHEFEKQLEVMHEMYSNASNEPIYWAGETRVLQKVANSKFRVMIDDLSPGIQVVDIALWLYSQFMKEKDFPPMTAKLLNHILRKSRISDFSFSGVSEAAEEQLREIFDADIPEDKIEAAKDMIEEFEARKKENLEAYAKDGLLPFERAGKGD